MNKTLKLKKGIGIIAIILGALRFFSGINSISNYNYIESEIANYSDNPQYDQNLINDLRQLVSLARVFVPLEIITSMAIFILGIVLLSVDNGKLLKEPREKSRRITVILLISSIIYALVEFTFMVSCPSSITKEINSATIIGSLGFVVTLIILCGIGLKGVKENNPYISELEKELVKITNTKQKEIEKLKTELEKTQDESN
jgi:choline-glycine betaine transporter